MDFFRHFVFEVTKSASGQMHVFLERYGSMLPSEVLQGGRCDKKVVSAFLSIQDLRALASCPSAQTAEAGQ